MSSDVFYRRRSSNQFDNLVVDVDDIYARFPLERRADWPCTGPPRLATIERLSTAPFLPYGTRTAASRLLTHLRIDQRWFRRFQSYWSEVLGGRPLLSVEDFHFLRGLYRVRHQDNQVPDTVDAGVHLQAWQRPELLYQVFHQAYGDALGPKHAVCAAIRLNLRGPLRTLLEFGAASAPVTTTWLDFHGPSPHTTFVISDIKTLALHYGTFKWRRAANVRPLLLDPAQGFALQVDDSLDVICCLTVFEHLPRPAATVRQLHDALRPGGLLVFDYLQTAGEGLDSGGGVRERDETLRFIEEHFEIAMGKIAHDRSMDLTVARKR